MFIESGKTVDVFAKPLPSMLLVCRSDSLSALARMEKWRERKEALPEYEKVGRTKNRSFLFKIQMWVF